MIKIPYRNIRRMYTNPRSSTNLKCFIATIFLVSAAMMGILLYLFISYVVGKLSSTDRSAFLGYNEHRIKPNTILQVAHLDLKGAPPKMSYLIDLVPRFVSAGVTGLLIEYEDMFPYEGQLRNITTTKPYTKSELTRFLQYCSEQNIEVIPLIQTFGHMEHVLKLNQYQFHREVKEDPRVVCPSFTRSKFVIEDMIRQVMALHKDSKRIHIGCDEVYVVNECQRCRKRREPAWEILFGHIRSVAKFIQEEFEFKVTPLIWDDMLRWRTLDQIKKSDLPYFVEIVIWDYTLKLDKQIRNQIWDKYALFFKKIWVAGAYKGADGPKALLPSMSTRHENHKSWMQFINKKTFWSAPPPGTPSIVGFISTGWSRYDHFAPLCELLPASIPSLMLTSLQTSAVLGRFRNYIADYNELLKCRRHKIASITLTIEEIYNASNTKYCSYPETQLVYNIWRLEQLQAEVDRIFELLYGKKGRLGEYQVKTNMISIRNIEEQYNNDDVKFDITYNDFSKLYMSLKNDLGLYFNDITITEWFETHVEPYLEKLTILENARKAAAKIIVWPRRNP